ncbi:hypothetical protein K7X08_017781 [Anisodus acutangulus]|uniref:non-specific serine/threonine protein kinase n=1 Tax=Anisodus acutangulus TaxID=402998 RepID=A0A9Q1LUG2_9SOLA|nr:hypothetical protein K7X08_017781 [Anisodus acutangulus]
MQLHGTIPPHLGNLSFLVFLNISYNSFRGDLPEELAHLQRLKLIDVASNNFTGVIPSFLSLFLNLRIVRLSSNQFSGEIPSSISNLTKLQVLKIKGNFLVGEIRRELGYLHYMTFLDLQNNPLTGSVPPSIFNITTMQFIGLTGNNLTGELPTTICDHLPNLEGLYLSDNNLDDVIPPNLEKCRKLQIMSLSHNEFSGTVPRVLANLTALTELYLGFQHLEGEIPVELGNLKKLQVLGLAENEFTGSVPTSIFNLSVLQNIGLEGNRLSGTLPPDLGRGMPSLDKFNCANNHLGGFISAFISNSSRLTGIDLGINSFTGPIPESLGNYLEALNLQANNFFSDSTLSFLISLTNCRKLRVLHLGGNNFSSNSALSFLASLTNCRKLRLPFFYRNPLDGVLPASVGNLSGSPQMFEGQSCKLKGMILSNNKLTGNIPKSVQGMMNLQELYLQSNKIEGTIPDFICDLKNLGALDLSGNRFSGSVPPCIGNVASLRQLYLASNKLNSRLPASLGSLQDLIEFNVSSNLLSAKIPLETGNLKVATLIDLSKNDFSGEIPNTLGGLDRLTKHSLAHNRLDGPIPDPFGKMLALDFLDMCNNNLNVGSPFANFTSQSFISNNALCGDSKFHAPPCIIKSAKRKRAILILYVSLGHIYFKIAKDEENAGQAYSLLQKGHERISCYELEQAKEIFNESNLLGTGGFSMVYKGILKNGTLLASKVFNAQLKGSFKSIAKECEMLRNLRHRNLTKVVTSCSTTNFKALVLEYMPNGTLEKWLYSHNFFLDMLQRLDIMIDVASATDYLHNGCSTPVVHCDLKPSNVLIDQEMVGHVSDFGIAKLLGAGEDFVQTKTIATIRYIAPEYGQDGIVSTSCDIYSFGILMMETFTRRRPSDEMFTGDFSIRRWVNDSFPSGIHKVVDANSELLGDEPTDAKMQCLSSIMELALNCTLANT